MKHLKLALPALAALLIGIASSSCAPNKATSVIKPIKAAPIAATPSPAPDMDAMRKTSSDADVQASLAAERLAKAKESAANAQANWRSALLEADRLRKQKTATENELTNLYNQIAEQDTQYASVITEMAATDESLQKERKLRAEVSVQLGAAQAKVLARDAENLQLRTQLKTAADQAQAYFEVADKNAKAASDAYSVAAISEGRIKTWRNIAGGLLALFLLSIGAHVLRSYMHI